MGNDFKTARPHFYKDLFSGGGVGPLNFEICQSKNFLLKWKLNSINAKKKYRKRSRDKRWYFVHSFHGEHEHYVDPLIFITQCWKVAFANIFAKCPCLLSCSGISGAITEIWFKGGSDTGET